MALERIIKILDKLHRWSLRKNLSRRWLKDDKIINGLIEKDKAAGCVCEVIESPDNFHLNLKLNHDCLVH